MTSAETATKAVRKRRAKRRFGWASKRDGGPSGGGGRSAAGGGVGGFWSEVGLGKEGPGEGPGEDGSMVGGRGAKEAVASE